MKFLNYIYKLLIFISLLFLYSGCDNVDKTKDINVVFRFDDPSELSSTETELKVITAFREHNASLTFGIIPFKCAGSTRDTSPQDVVPLSKEKSALLKKAIQEGTIDIALHGYSHQIRDTKVWTEFSGLQYEHQLEKLSKGKKYLEQMMGTDISIFIPPYNTYDLNTLKALEALNFSTISADIKGPVANIKLNYMPMTIKLHQIDEAVAKARASVEKNPLIVVMFHEYDFLDVEIEGITNRTISFEELNQHLKWLKSQNNIRIISMTQAIKMANDLSYKRIKMVKLYSFLQPIIPKFMRESISVYPETSSVLTVLMKTTFLYLFVLIFSMVFFYYVVCFISINLVKLISIGNMILTLAFILYASYDLSIHFKGMIIITLMIGVTLGSWFCLKKNKKT